MWFNEWRCLDLCLTESKHWNPVKHFFMPTAALQWRCVLDEETETWGQIICPATLSSQVSERGWLPATRSQLRLLRLLNPLKWMVPPGPFAWACDLLWTHWHLRFHSSWMLGPYTLNFTVHHCEVKYNLAAGFLGYPQVIILITKVGRALRSLVALECGIHCVLKERDFKNRYSQYTPLIGAAEAATFFKVMTSLRARSVTA